MIFIYGLVDPRDKAVRYIGQTCSPSERLQSHIFSPQNGTSYWIRDLQTLGLNPVMLILDVSEGYAAKRAEWYWYYEYKDIGADLLNTASLRVADVTKEYIPSNSDLVGREYHKIDGVPPYCCDISENIFSSNPLTDARAIQAASKTRSLVSMLWSMLKLTNSKVCAETTFEDFLVAAREYCTENGIQMNTYVSNALRRSLGDSNKK